MPGVARGSLAAEVVHRGGEVHCKCAGSLDVTLFGSCRISVLLQTELSRLLLAKQFLCRSSPSLWGNLPKARGDPPCTFFTLAPDEIGLSLECVRARLKISETSRHAKWPLATCQLFLAGLFWLGELWRRSSV